MTNTIHSEGCNSTGAQGKQASQADEAARSLCRAGRKLAVPCAISTVTVSCSWLSSGGRGVQPEMNIQKLVRQCPMLSSGLRMGSSPSPLSLHNISIWVLSILPCLSQALRNCTSAQCLLSLPTGFPLHPHPRLQMRTGECGAGPSVTDQRSVRALAKAPLRAALVGLATQWDFSLIGSPVPNRTRELPEWDRARDDSQAQAGWNILVQ